MATTIITKNGSGAPSAGNLSVGELAVDLANKELYTKDSGGNVIKVGAQGGSTGTFTDLTATSSFTSPGIDDNATSTAITIDSSENVGIGTNSPQKELEVHSDGTTQVRIVGGDTGGAILNFGSPTIPADARIVYSNVSKMMQFRTNNGAYSLNIDASGNVGIGNSSPTDRLVVRDDSPTVAPFNVQRLGGGILARFTDISTLNLDVTCESGTSVGLNAVNQGVDLTFGVANTERMRITADGFVNFSRVFASQASKPFITQTSDGASQDLALGAQSSTGAVTFYTGASTSGTPFTGFNQERMRIDASGNLLVGTTSAPTTIGGSGFIASSDNRYVLSLGSDTSAPRDLAEFRTSLGLAGRIEVASLTTSYVTSSDERLKDNIVDAPVGNIDSLKVRSFDWKADGSHQEYGFIAQELETVAPYAVSKGETDEDMWGVDYSKLVPMLVKEIQDLKAEVAALKGA